MSGLLFAKCCCTEQEQPCYFIFHRCECSPEGAGVAVPCTSLKSIVDEDSIVTVYRPDNEICYEGDLAQTPTNTTELEIYEPTIFLDSCDDCCTDTWCEYQACPCSPDVPQTVYLFGSSSIECPDFIQATNGGCYEFVRFVNELPPGAVFVTASQIASCEACCNCPTNCDACPSAVVMSVEPYDFSTVPGIVFRTLEQANVVLTRDECLYAGCQNSAAVPAQQIINGNVVETEAALFIGELGCNNSVVNPSQQVRTLDLTMKYGNDQQLTCASIVQSFFAYYEMAGNLQCGIGVYQKISGTGPDLVEVA